MRIVLSRKGFDSAYGGVPSPILPGGVLCSLPIPGRRSGVRYADLRAGGHDAGRLVGDLTCGRLTGRDFAHLDPDLDPAAYPRQPGWRPMFGQTGAAQTHLARCGVAPGDLFLFFGWFRQAEWVAGRCRFGRAAPDLHVLFGWLQIGEIVAVQGAASGVPPWAAYHPHFQADYGANNTVYVAAERLQLGGVPRAAPAAGVFGTYRDALRLTAPGRTRTWWHLPAWFCPCDGRPPLTYHADPDRWSSIDGGTLLRSAPRGQEFVLDAGRYPQAVDWARALIEGQCEESGA